MIQKSIICTCPSVCGIHPSVSLNENFIMQADKMLDEFKIACDKVETEIKGWGVWFHLIGVGSEGIIYRHSDTEPNFKPGLTYKCVIE